MRIQRPASRSRLSRLFLRAHSMLIRLMSFHCIIHHLVIVIILLDASWSIRFLRLRDTQKPVVCTREARRRCRYTHLYAPAVYTHLPLA